VADSALAQLAKAGFDPIYGARPLKRAIQQSIENPLAKQILEGLSPRRTRARRIPRRRDAIREIRREIVAEGRNALNPAMFIADAKRLTRAPRR